MYFYDTNVLLQGGKEFLQKNFAISIVTLKELQNIKTSTYKDPEIKYKARKAVRWLAENRNKYLIFKKEEYSSSTPDLQIIEDAVKVRRETDSHLIFITFDLSCAIFAQQQGLNVQLEIDDKQDDYTGYCKIFCKTDEQLADFYQKINSGQQTEFSELFINQYLLVYDKDDQLIDKYKYLGDNKFQRLIFSTIDSKMFGKVKPMDAYQELAIDSFKSNKLTLIKGVAGTGKSLLSLAYLFKSLEEGQIDRIIIFCNTVATAGSAKLGYYPGNRTEKLLDSQIGNFLISKLGAREAVERLIEEGELILLPMSDIRGYDTSGMRAGIYITQAQNLSIQLLKLALQRIGQDSICILDGDNATQVDLGLYAGANNGMRRVSEVFKNQDFYGQVTLQVIHRSRIANIASQM